MKGMVATKGNEVPFEDHWFTSDYVSLESLLFKPADIIALAEEINGECESQAASTTELDILRKALENERRAREAAEAAAAQLRLELDDRHAARETEERDAAREAYRNHLECQAQFLTPPSVPEHLATRLTFPYSTRLLEAMHAVATKYWAGFTRDKRQPTQIEIQMEFCQLLDLSLSKSNTPPRSAITLATAIKPDNLPGT